MHRPRVDSGVQVSLLPRECGNASLRIAYNCDVTPQSQPTRSVPVHRSFNPPPCLCPSSLALLLSANRPSCALAHSMPLHPLALHTETTMLASCFLLQTTKTDEQLTSSISHLRSPERRSLHLAPNCSRILASDSLFHSLLLIINC